MCTTSKSKDKMKSRFFLDVIIGKSSSVFKLFSGENKSLLIWWDTFFILDLGFDVFNGVRWFNIKSDGFTSEGLNEDLHSTSESEDKMKGWFLLDVVVSKGSSVFKLFSSEDESLLIWWNSFFVLDFGFDILNRVWWFDIKGDCLSC